MKFKRGEHEWTGIRLNLEFEFERVLQRPRLALCNLVLDRDVRTRLVKVLVGEGPVEVVGNHRAQFQKLFRGQRNGRSGAKVHEPAYLSARRGELGGDARKEVS